MAGPTQGTGRPRDADRARAAILEAAEEVFAEDGFDGARVEAIARTAHYNSSLLFRYFGDKSSLYAEVLRRADRELGALLASRFAPLHEDALVTRDLHHFRSFLRTTFGSIFDYMVEHPRFTRIVNWEQAEGWRTFAQIAPKFAPDDLARFEELFAKARAAGLLRSDLDVGAVVVLIAQLSWSTPAALPLYRLVSREGPPASILSHIREQILDVLVRGLTDSCDEQEGR